jgi:hypothetical protein
MHIKIYEGYTQLRYLIFYDGTVKFGELTNSAIHNADLPVY